ncbi:MAG: methyl-accepting chemotaxis protein, partial [Bacillota bacterium]|nr:methyl-accepting chemotaxis protein [Bacillota bacterium]
SEFNGREKEYEKIAEKGKGNFVWFIQKGGRSEENYILAMNQIYNEATGDLLGTMVVVLEDSFISKTYKTINIDGSSDIFLIGSDGIIISTKNNERIKVNTAYSNAKLINELSKVSNAKMDINKQENAAKSAAGSFYSVDKGKKFMYSYSKIPDTDWFVVAAIPFSYIQVESNNIRNWILIVGCIIFLLSIAISLLMSTSITRPLYKLQGQMEEAKNGNLSIRIHDEFNDEISILNNNFNDMIGNIKNLVSNVNNSSRQVLGSAEKVSQLSSDYYYSAEQVAVSIEQIAKGTSNQAEDNYKSLQFVNSLSKDINKVYDEMELVAKITHDTKALCENALISVESLNEKSLQTSKVTDDIVVNINELNVDMREIQKILKFIGNISEQTNLLSLNAAIEAAKAGEAGRGFAVVAEQVRKLADQTKESLTSISSVIKNIQQKTMLASDSANNTHEIIKVQMNAVSETDNSFKAILNSMENIMSFMTNFESAVSKILESGKNTHDVINSISSVSEEIAATVEEISATAQQQIEGIEEVSNQSKFLNEMAQGLNKSISFFKV